MRNRVGPSTEPCGTPESTGAEADDLPTSTTLSIDTATPSFLSIMHRDACERMEVKTLK